MRTLFRVLSFVLPVTAVAGMFLLVSVNQRAQTQFPSPTGHVNDFANIIDSETRARLENLLQNLKSKTQIDFSIATVDTTGNSPIEDFAKSLSRDWNIGAFNSRGKSLLLVVSAGAKQSFTQYSRPAQRDLPDGILSDMAQHMRSPLAEGHFSEAITTGVNLLVGSVAQKAGISLEELDRPSTVATTTSSEAPSEKIADTTIQTDQIADSKKTRPRAVTRPIQDVKTDELKIEKAEPLIEKFEPKIEKAEPTVEKSDLNIEKSQPKIEKAEPTVEKSNLNIEKSQPKIEEAEPTVEKSDLNIEKSQPKIEKAEPTVEKSDPNIEKSQPKIENTLATKLDRDDNLRNSPKSTGPTTKSAQADEDKQPNSTLDDDESEEVELTLTKPLAERAILLKQFLETHPNSKSRTRATELLISTHAGLGDQRLKNGDNAGGIEQMMLAITEANPGIADILFSGVISQIPMNLYLRGEKEAAFKAATSIEEKFGADPKRLLAVAAFYLSIERGGEATRVGESVAKMAPDMAEAHRVMAVGYHFSLRLNEAAQEYKRAVELDPSLKVARVSLADLSRATGKFEEALALYNDELKTDPKDRAARAGAIISLLELGRRDEATSALNSALTDDPDNLPLLSSAGYWFVAHDDNDKAFELARKAVTLEPRYTWAQIALARALLGLKQPLDAERSLRYAKQFGKFPTLNYELGTVLASMGLYDEAAEVLRESFSVKDDQIETQLAGRITTRDKSFRDLLAPERQAGIFQMKGADSLANANQMKALVAFSEALNAPEGQKIDTVAAVSAGTDFASGRDNMRVYRQLYVASRLVRNNIGLRTALELVEEAKKGADSALDGPNVTLAVQADEFREARARAISNGNVPSVAEAPRNVLSHILKGRLEDLHGWILFNDEKVPAAIEHLKLAESTLPTNTPAWRTALWHLGVACEQSGKQQEALDYYIKSYTSGEPDSVHLSMIQQLYRKMNGSLDGLEDKIGSAVQTNIEVLTGTNAPVGETAASTGTEPKPNATPTASSSSETTEKPPVIDTKSEINKDAKSALTKPETPSRDPGSESVTTTPPPEPSPSPAPNRADDSGSEDSLRAIAARARSTVRITGRVLDSDQNGIANVAVVLISPSGTVLAATTNNDGVYKFTVAPSVKTYRVIPSKDGYSFSPIDKALTGIRDDQKAVDFVGNKAP